MKVEMANRAKGIFPFSVREPKITTIPSIRFMIPVKIIMYAVIDENKFKDIGKREK